MPDILTPEEVAECRERAERATEELDWGVLKTLASLCDDYADALAAIELHKHARTDIPALCATVEALREVVRELASTHLITDTNDGGGDYGEVAGDLIIRAGELSR